MDGTETSLTKQHSNTITRLSQEHLNIIYLLILHHYINTNKANIAELPYGSKTISNGKGVLFKRISQIPEPLQKIIHRYLSTISQ